MHAGQQTKQEREPFFASVGGVRVVQPLPHCLDLSSRPLLHPSLLPALLCPSPPHFPCLRRGPVSPFVMAVRVTNSRPLPQTPMYPADRDAAWYEHEERMRPSYITPSTYQQPAFYTAATAASPPPLSPSAKWGASSPQRQQYPFPNAASPRHSQPSPARATAGDQGPIQASRPRHSHLNSAPSRFHSPKDAYRPFAYDQDEVRRTGVVKGSAFMVSSVFLSACDGNAELAYRLRSTRVSSISCPWSTTKRRLPA